MSSFFSSRLVGGVTLVALMLAGRTSPAALANAEPPRPEGQSSLERPISAATPAGDDFDPQGCAGIPPCSEIKKFRARCRLRVIGLLIIKVRLVPPAPGPQKNVLVGVNGQRFCVPFGGRVAKLVLENRVGQQFCELLDPPNCFPPIQADCGP